MTGQRLCGFHEWAHRRQVNDIREGRMVHTRGYNDSHPALDKPTTTPPLTIDSNRDGDNDGDEGRRQGRQAS
jgi:hypothetical protein